MSATTTTETVVGIFLLTCIGCHSTRSLDITSASSDVIQFENSNVTFACTVSGRGFDYFFNQIIWYKVVEGDEEEVEIQINTGAIINEPFYSSRRYTIEPVMSEYTSEISLLLTITDILREDNGTFRCVLFNKQQRLSTVRHSLFIPAPVDQLSLSITNINEDLSNESSVTMTTVANGVVDVYEVEENQPVRVECVASGRGEVPDVRVTFGQRLDVTSSFSKVQSERRVGPRGLDVINYDVRFIRESFQLSADDDGKHIKCSARVGGFPEIARRVSTAVDVRYAPKFMCGKERSASLGHRSFRLDCVIRANPAVDMRDVTWFIGDHLNATSVTAEKETSDELFSSTAHIDAERKHLINVALKINEVTSLRYHVYRLVANNSVGQRHFHITLRQTNIRPPSIAVAGNQFYDVIYTNTTNQVQGHLAVTPSLIILTCLLSRGIIS